MQGWRQGGRGQSEQWGSGRTQRVRMGLEEAGTSCAGEKAEVSLTHLGKHRVLLTGGGSGVCKLTVVRNALCLYAVS